LDSPPGAENPRGLRAREGEKIATIGRYLTSTGGLPAPTGEPSNGGQLITVMSCVLRAHGRAPVPAPAFTALTPPDAAPTPRNAPHHAALSKPLRL
jgi:hypothetical protein